MWGGGVTPVWMRMRIIIIYHGFVNENHYHLPQPTPQNRI